MKINHCMKQLHIMDTMEISPNEMDYPVFLYWRIWGNRPECSVLYYQEQFQVQTTSEYLHWLHCFAGFQISGKPLRDHLALSDGYSAWWLSVLFEKHPVWYEGGMFEIFKLRALERYAEEHGFDEIILHSTDERLHQALEGWCRGTGRLYSWCEAKENIDAKKCSEPSQHFSWLRCFVKTIRTLIDWLINRRWKFRFRAHTKCCKGIALTSWFPNIDANAAAQNKFHSNYWGDLHKLLPHLKTPVNWLLIYFGKSEDIRKHVAVRNRIERHGSEKLTFWEEHVGLKTVFRAVYNWIKVSRSAFALDKYLEQLCEWPDSRLKIIQYIRPLWYKSTRSGHLLMRILISAGIGNWAEKIGPQQIALALSENQPWERIFYQTLRKQGSSLLCAVPHSATWRLDTRYMISPLTRDLPEFAEQSADIYLCNGRHFSEQLVQGGYAQGNVKVVEALRYQYLGGVNYYEDVQRHPSVRTLLVVTSTFHKEVEVQIQILSEAIRKGLPDNIFEVLIKPHPDCPVEPYLNKFFFDLPLPTVTATPLSELLKPDMLVYAGNSTSACIEAAYKCLPLIIQGAVNDFNLCPLAGEQTVVFIKTAEELLRVAQNPPIINIPHDFFYLNDGLPLWKEVFNIRLNASRPEV